MYRTPATTHNMSAARHTPATPASFYINSPNVAQHVPHMAHQVVPNTYVMGMGYYALIQTVEELRHIIQEQQVEIQGLRNDAKYHQVALESIYDEIKALREGLCPAHAPAPPLFTPRLDRLDKKQVIQIEDESPKRAPKELGKAKGRARAQTPKPHPHTQPPPPTTTQPPPPTRKGAPSRPKAPSKPRSTYKNVLIGRKTDEVKIGQEVVLEIPPVSPSAKTLEAEFEPKPQRPKQSFRPVKLVVSKVPPSMQFPYKKWREHVQDGTEIKKGAIFSMRFKRPFQLVMVVEAEEASKIVKKVMEINRHVQVLPLIAEGTQVDPEEIKWMEKWCQEERHLATKTLLRQELAAIGNKGGPAG